MKTLAAKTLVLVSALFMMVACDDSDTTQAVSKDEAADMAAYSLAEESSGMSVVITTSTTGAGDAVDGSDDGKIASCGYTSSVDINATNPSGTLITYDYDYSYYYQLTCNDSDVPTSLVSSITFDGEFDAPRLASAHSGSSYLTITALDDEATSYIVNGSYERDGTFESKIRNKNTSSSSVEIMIEDVVVNKTTKEIEGGTGTVVIYGEVTGKGSFSYRGSISFNGDGTITIVISGEKYVVDLETGDVG